MDDASELLDQALLALSSFVGLVADSTVRGSTWRFLDVGRCLERGIYTTELLRYGSTRVGPRVARLHQLLLDLSDASMTYRTRYMSAARWDRVLDLLALDESHPRSVAFQVAQISDHLTSLGADSAAAVVQVRDRLRQCRAWDLCPSSEEADAAHGSRRLDALLSDVTAVLFELSENLDRTYLSHTLPSQQPSALQRSLP